MTNMKKTYQKPEITGVHADTCQPLLKSSYVPVGGTGSFDVKEDENWDELWEEDE